MSNQKTRKIVIDQLIEQGRATPDDLVADARSKNHPLHDDFNWDDKSAAHQHRLDKAREIFRSVIVNVRTEAIRIVHPEYVHDPRAEKQGYVPVARLQNETTYARDLLDAEIDRIISLVNRARSLAAALDLSDEFEDLLRAAVNLKAARAKKRSADEGMQTAMWLDKTRRDETDQRGPDTT